MKLSMVFKAVVVEITISHNRLRTMTQMEAASYPASGLTRRGQTRSSGWRIMKKLKQFTHQHVQFVKSLLDGSKWRIIPF